MSTTTPVDDLGWQTRGACRTQDLELFFSTRAADIRAAKAICGHACPVTQQCRTWVLSPSTPAIGFGVIAGMAAKTRQQIRLSHRAPRRRHQQPHRPGEKTLTPAQVDAIRGDTRSSYAVSRDYEIAASTVQRIRRGARLAAA